MRRLCVRVARVGSGRQMLPDAAAVALHRYSANMHAHPQGTLAPFFFPRSMHVVCALISCHVKKGRHRVTLTYLPHPNMNTDKRGDPTWGAPCGWSRGQTARMRPGPGWPSAAPEARSSAFVAEACDTEHVWAAAHKACRRTLQSGTVYYKRALQATTTLTIAKQ